MEPLRSGSRVRQRSVERRVPGSLLLLAALLALGAVGYAVGALLGVPS